MEKQFDVLVIGDINPDIMMINYTRLPEPGQETHVERAELALGGGGAITGTGLAKMGLKTAIYSFVGDDTMGKFMLKELEKTGVCTDYIKPKEGVGTGVSIAFTTEVDRSFLTYNGSNAILDIEDTPEDVLSLSNHIHLLGYSAHKHDKYVKFVKKLKAKGKTVSFDIGYDDTEQWDKNIVDIVKLVDVFSPNEVEAQKYMRSETVEQALEKFAEIGNTIVVKKGSEGSVAYRDGEYAEATPFKTKCIDTTGAGDSFICGFLYGWLKELPLKDCLTYGNAVGAKCVEAYGGTPGVPTIGVIEEMVRSRGE